MCDIDLYCWGVKTTNINIYSRLKIIQVPVNQAYRSAELAIKR